MTARGGDAVLELLPVDRPRAFDRLPEDEQAWRGRLWLIMFGAGYQPDHAWWFVLYDEPDWVRDMKALVAEVPDDHYALMVQGRLTYEAGKALVGDAVQ